MDASNFLYKLALKNLQENFGNLSCEEKEFWNFCKSHNVTLDEIPTWKEYSKEYNTNVRLNDKVSIFVGDITTLEIDVIVNATDNYMSGGGGVDEAIHEVSGISLFYECEALNGLKTGESKITNGYNLPAKYVIHTAGPIGEGSEVLEDCYINSLHVAQAYGLRSIAFPCIATGTFQYPNHDAAHVALRAVRNFLEKNESSLDRVVFCLFLPIDIQIYEELMKLYFPN